MAHQFVKRGYYSDTDAGGIVYHARYLDFAEHARTELFRAVSKDRPAQQQLMSEHRIGFVVRSITVDFLVPALLDDLLTIHTSLVKEKRFTLEFLQEVKRDQQLLCTLNVTVAALNLDTKRPVPFEPWFAEAARTR